ncbi:MAG: DUF2508 family protein [Oscillospiraceae bacterium]|nr:DUF2508 family protein [Oscillospiraceae bacterium]
MEFAIGKFKLFQSQLFKAKETTTQLQEVDLADIMDQIKECQYLLRRNENLFNLECDSDMIEARIFERESLLARYTYLLNQLKLQKCKMKGEAEESCL